MKDEIERHPPLRSGSDAVNFAEMTVPAQATSPRDFGAALRAAREKHGVSIDVIAERTKIARRVLELFEAGEFAKLPNRVFMRLFLQQYLSLIGERQQDWAASFEATWQRFEDASQPWEIAAPSPSRAARWLPWVIGLVVVVGGLAGVVLVERQHNGEKPAIVPATPEIPPPSPVPPTAPPMDTAAASTGLPAAPSTQPTAAPAVPTSAPADAQTLVLRTTDRPCWVEAHIAGERPLSRLMPASSEWRLPAAGRAVNLIVGDGGALQVDYLGERRDRAGADGEVVHLRIGPAPGSAGPTP